MLIFSLGVYILIGWYTGLHTVEAFRITSHTMGTVEVPYAPFYATVTLGCFVMSIRLLIQLKEALIDHKSPGEELS